LIIIIRMKRIKTKPKPAHKRSKLKRQSGNRVDNQPEINESKKNKKSQEKVDELDSDGTL